jgi:hypothetical protein
VCVCVCVVCVYTDTCMHAFMHLLAFNLLGKCSTTGAMSTVLVLFHFSGRISGVLQGARERAGGHQNVIFLPIPPVAGTTDVSHHTWLVF